MKRVFNIILLIFCISIAWSQPRTNVGAGKEAEKKEKPKKEKAWMKPPEKPNESVMAAWAPVTLDHYFAIKGGYGMGSARFEPIKQMQSYIGMLNFGISYRLDMTVPLHKYVGSIEFGLEYAEKGFAYETYYESGIVYKRRYSMLMLPILWQPYLPFTKTGETRFFANVGPYLGYALNSSYYTENTKTGEKYNIGQWEYDQLRDNRFEYGVTVGAGLMVAIKRRVLIGLDFRYNIMLSDIFKGVNKYEGNPFRSPVDNMSLSFKIEVKFSSSPKKKKQKQAEIEAIK